MCDHGKLPGRNAGMINFIIWQVESIFTFINIWLNFNESAHLNEIELHNSWAAYTINVLKYLFLEKLSSKVGESCLK